MPGKIKVSAEDWLSLYALAGQARDLAPWEILYEDELFGLRLPDDPTTYYCSIMGRGGEHRAFCFYRGDSGLTKFRALRDLASSDQIFSPVQFLRYQDCLQVSFEDSDALQPEQKKHLQNLGVRFRGRGQWISLTDFSPGLFPWLIAPEQVGKVTALLTQAIAVVRRKQEAPDWFGAWINPGQSMPVFTLDQRGHWEESRPEIQPPAVTRSDRAANFPAAWQELTKFPYKEAQIAFGQLFLSSVVQEKKGARPYYPVMILGVEMKKDAVVGLIMTPPGQDSAQEIELLQTFQNLGFRPKKILVGEAETLDLLLPGCTLAGITVLQNERAAEKINAIGQYMAMMIGE